jgi:hypothetical protein
VVEVLKNGSLSLAEYPFTDACVPPASPVLVARGPKISRWHLMTLVGYDERRQAFRLINSWGKGWGDHGYAWIGYDLLRSRITGAYVLDVARPDPQPNLPPQPSRPPPTTELVPPRPPAPVSPPVPVAPVPLPAPVTPGPGTQLAGLQSLSCGRVNGEVRGSQFVLSGYVATDDDLKQVKLVAANVRRRAVPRASG